MRKMDKDKPITSKVGQTISFEKFVLTRMEKMAEQQGSSVSNLVNKICREILVSDVAYWRLVMKEKNREFQEAKYMREEAEKLSKENGEVIENEVIEND